VVIIRLSRLGWAQEWIAQVVGTSQGRITQIINNTNFGKINNLLSQCRDMNYIAGHYQMDLAQAWALWLEGKSDQEKFKKEKENEGKAITIFDYHRILSKTGWKVTHRIECPLSSERMSGNEVQKMQEKRILGTVGRSIIIAKR